MKNTQYNLFGGNQMSLLESPDFFGIGMAETERRKDKQERIRELQETDHNFWNDPGHGWLEVEVSDLTILGIKDKISAYSYKSKGKAYLEEDCDASVYIKALFPDLEDMKFLVFKSRHLKDCYKENIFIRNLPNYK